jgi:hypothetical protein
MATHATTARVVRWLARVWSLASVTLVALFVIGEGFDPSELTPDEWLGFAFFPFGISLGMLLAWRREGLGGAITTGCLLAFYAVHRATAGSFPRGWAWFVFAAPGMLFLLCWLLARSAVVDPARQRAASDAPR